MATGSKTKAKPRETLKSVRTDINSIVTRLETVDKTTQDSIAALETALRSLAQRTQDNPARQKEVETQIDALKTHLVSLIRDTQRAVNADLKAVLDDPRMTTLATAIDQADNRLRQTEAEQAQNLDTLKNYIAELAREVDKNLGLERKARQAALAATDAKQANLQQDIATCLKTIKTNSDALEATHTHIKGIESDTAMALENIGEKVASLAEQAKDAREEQARVLKAKVSDIALETQHNFNGYREEVDRNIESLREAHETNKQELAHDLDNLRTRLETLEYGFSPHSAARPHNTTAPTTVVEDAFTPHLPEVNAETAPVQSSDVESAAAQLQPQQEQLPISPPPFVEIPVPFVNETTPANPYATNNVTYDNIVETFPQTDPQGQALETFTSNPYAQLQDTIAQGHEVQNNFAPYDVAGGSGPIHDFNNIETDAYDMPYANPAYAEANMTMEQSRPGTPLDAPKGVSKRSKLFTPSNLRAAVLGVAVLGVGYYAMGKLRGENPTSNNLPEEVFVENPSNDLVASTGDGIGITNTNVQNLEPIGNYSNDVNSSVKNTADAKSLLETAANNGNPVAEYQLGLIKLQAGDTQEALSLLRASANKGQAVAQYRLAKLYETGTGITRDLQTARTLIEKAARNGNRIAMHDLANFYANGTGGVEQDLGLAAQWFEKAAERGVVDSQYNIGYLYEFGFGVTKNPVEAYVWYNIASAQGDTEAGRRIVALSETLSDVEISSAKTRVAGFKPVKIDDAANGIFKDTPWRADKPSNNNSQVANVQGLLNDLGYSVGEADGQIGARTRSAIIAFEKANGLPETGRINANLVNQLQLATGV